MDITKLNIGDKVFVVNEKNNAFARNKIKMVDADGVEWYRYDKGVWSYEIEEVEYTGRVIYTIEGTVLIDEDRCDEYCFLYPDGLLHSELIYRDIYDDRENFFFTREEAEQYGKRITDERNSY